MATSNPPQPGPDAFHRERSRCLDGFAALEQSVIALLVRAQVKITNGPFGQKVQSLKKLEPGKGVTNSACLAASVLADDIATILDVRNDLVHARLQIALIGNDQRACFINARQCTSGAQLARLFSLESLREVTRKANLIAEQLAAL